MKKINTHRLIKEPFFLITQSLNYRFIDKDFLMDHPLEFTVEKLKNGRGKAWSVDQNGSLYNNEDETLEKHNKFFDEYLIKDEFKKDLLKIRDKKIKERKTIQIVRSFFINKEGIFIDDDLHTFQDRLYKKFALAKTNNDLSRLISKYNFCDFVDASKNLNENNLDHDMECLVPTEPNTTRRINWMEIYRKREIFFEIFENFLQRKTTTLDMDILKETMKSHINDVYLDQKNFEFLSNVEIDDKEPEEESMGEYFSEKLSSENQKVKMIYGHFALCCLELYLEIEKELPEIAFCANPQCGKQLPLFRNRHQKLCMDNPKCHREWNTLQKQVQRSNRKKRKKTKEAKLPKRNLT